jgi:hypothetical protein
MPNILIDQLPTAVEIAGQEYEIDTDFKTCIRVILAFEDDTLTLEEKYQVMLTNLFPIIPDDLTKAFEFGIRFLNGGESSEEKHEGYSPRVYSFSKDANLIYAAFQQTHRIDLAATEYLHWWKFLALFMDLGADTVFCNLVSLRKRVKTGKASKEEMKAYRDMNDDLRDPDTRTIDEKERESEFLRLVKEQRR